MKCKQDSMKLYNADFDTCGGGSGSVVYETSTKKAIGIFMAEYNQNRECYNLVTRILDNAAGGVNRGFGVSLKALMKKVPA